ncbi:alpha-amylase family protein [Alkalicoccobacillus porphyridii]|uniref:Family 10 glycosylhydrolase n=1 Tax=Alkalicoccobacillus porphyridii TaxID=2597270 RepID=A0A554A226_9BACI|nr:alpha-amylase family protein [Alkalicoccobacillus porphyridii]TSB47751.1 family 10 glycosylhydrolase [Alkalicoccobacillus porphyridii]
MADPKLDVWWKKNLRVIQPNLQVKDTGKIDPDRLADQLLEMGANTVVFNVGGIYAWYPTEVSSHTLNNYLPANQDLLLNMIEAVHKRKMRFIARFDFSKAEDSIYLRNPQWFVRDLNNKPQIIGSHRPGNWSLLMSTCINGTYRTDEVAIPVINEVISKYPIDGIFLNNPGYIPCYCDTCKRKYVALYGEELPAEKKLFHPEWATKCMEDNIDRLYSEIKQKNADMPLILYYNLYRDSLYDRAKTADMLCTEPQDILSLGSKNIPEFWKPALSTKLGRSLENYPHPFGIVHSSPGMDWRHTGLPPAEYQFWLCQIPANGGQIWHSLTGIPDTIHDKRILEVVTQHNDMVKKVAPFMEKAESNNEVALVWNAAPSGEGWADGLLERQISFDVLLPEQLEQRDLGKYRAIVIPENLQWTESMLKALNSYTSKGGGLIVEGLPEDVGAYDLLGIEPETHKGEELTASYLRFEKNGKSLQKGLEKTELIAHRGNVVYCKPQVGSETLATLVPPFSPLESVGAPPERASLAVEKTDIPLVIHRKNGDGRVIFLPFSLSMLINEFRLNEHYILLDNIVEYAVGTSLSIKVNHAPGLQVSVFKQDNGNLLIHLVNGAGRRPLTRNLPIHNVEVKVRSSDLKALTSADAVISGENLHVEKEDDTLVIQLPILTIWEVLSIS